MILQKIQKMVNGYFIPQGLSPFFPCFLSDSKIFEKTQFYFLMLSEKYFDRTGGTVPLPRRNRGNRPKKPVCSDRTSDFQAQPHFVLDQIKNINYTDKNIINIIHKIIHAI